MRSFREWVCESFDLATILTHTPKNGVWEPSLEDSASSHVFRFDVDGDDGEDLKAAGWPANKPIYSASISGVDSASISFKRGESYRDERRGVGTKVMRGVLAAIGQYITHWKPKQLNWSAITKTTAAETGPRAGEVVNPQARGSVYDQWAVKNLFPDRYVGMSGRWIRTDVYQKDYVSRGFPSIPATVKDESGKEQPLNADSTAGLKRKAIEDMREKAERSQDDINRAEAEIRHQEEEERERRRQQEAEERERRRQEALNQMVADPQQNPDHVAVGDIVRVIDYAEYDNVMRQAGKVVSFRAGRGGYYEDENDLYAIVKFATEAEPDNYEHDRSVKVARLQKETPERIAERRRRHEEELQASLNSPQFNPNGIRIGDEIISRTTDPNHEHSGLHGVVRDIIRRPNGELYAKVDWDERSGGVLGHYVNQPCNITFLYKATPEELEKLRRSRISHNIEQEVQRGREEHLRRSFGNRNDISAADPELVNDTVNNPQGFKPGDFVNVDYRYGRGRSTGGVIVRMERSYWRPDIDAYVKFHRSAEQPRRYSLSRLTRDTSEQAQRMQQRQQQVIQRHQQITQGAGDINIGDTVRVNSGLNRNRIGRVVGFQTGTRNNVRVTCLDNEGVRFTANVSAISKMAA